MRRALLIILISMISQNFYSQVDSMAIPLDPTGLELFQITNLKSADQEPMPAALQNVIDRFYIKNVGIEAYRENLDELLGRLVIQNKGDSEIGFMSVKKDSAIIKSFVPTAGKLISHRLTKKSAASLNVFLNVSATDERIYEYFVTDISRAILSSSKVDKELLKKAVQIANEDDISKYYIITGVTVTEIYKRDFTKSEKKLKASDLPLGGIAISVDGNFFVSDENYEREYKLGLTIASLQQVSKEVAAFLK